MTEGISRTAGRDAVFTWLEPRFGDEGMVALGGVHITRGEDGALFPQALLCTAAGLPDDVGNHLRGLCLVLAGAWLCAKEARADPAAWAWWISLGRNAREQIDGLAGRTTA